MNKILFTLSLLFLFQNAIAQPDPTDKQVKDSLYILEVEEFKEIDKVLHAEPLYIDLIRDLGARKGEKEWNVGIGLNPKKNFDSYEALVEYEWAPLDRLGLEVEVPVKFYNQALDSIETPGSKIESFKVAAQWSFYVSQKYSLSMALGYLHEFEFPPFRDYKSSRFYTGNLFNPFFIGAKRWGNNWHTLLYTGPQILHEFGNTRTEFQWEINSNIHYMISGTRNFIGLEVNKMVGHEFFEMTLRPQMRLEINEQLMLGIVTGFNLSNPDAARLSTFLRLIYEPRVH
jgi:hypothetical protein